jgi:Kef-type K+ transport system membrane component KefB
VIVGPSVLGNFRFWSTHVFSPSSWNYFTLVGNIGLILFMFNLGLELERKELKHQWKSTLPVSIATIIVPYAIGAVFALYLYNINNRDGFTPPDRAAFILLTASSMSFTAFPVLAAILSSTNLMSTPIGTLTISSGALNDIIGWCSLAVASAFAKGSAIAGLW